MLLPDVSVLTAMALRPGNRIAEIHAALCASAVAWEWVVQVDDEALPELPDDERIQVRANGRRLGIAVTRNRGLARARGALVLNADADDVPVPGAMDALAPAFDDPSVGLAFGDWVEHWPDGGTWRTPIRFAPGRLAPRTIGAIWATERWVPMHLAGAMWRREAVLRAGGWTAQSGGSDIGLMLGVDATWASAYIPQDTFTHHHHAAQTTADPAWHARFDLDLEFLLARARALGYDVS